MSAVTYPNAQSHNRTTHKHRTNKSPLLVSYLFSIGDPRHPSPLCPLCLMHDHTSSHLFECKSLPTSLSSLDLWTNPDKVEPFLATWGERLLAATWFRVLDYAGSTLVEWGRQQQQQQQLIPTFVRWLEIFSFSSEVRVCARQHSENPVSITLNGLQRGIMFVIDAIYPACRCQEVGNGHTRSWQSLIAT